MTTIDCTTAIDTDDGSMSDVAKVECFCLLAVSLLESGKAREAHNACLLAEKRLTAAGLKSGEAKLEALKAKALIAARRQDISLQTVKQRKRKFDLSMLPTGLQSDLHLYGPSSDGKSTNLLILLHGLGDAPTPYYQLANQMKLPQTCCVALAGPLQIPLLDEGRAWFEAFDEEFNLIQPAKGDRRRLISLRHTTTLLCQFIDQLVLKGNFLHNEIHLFGYSQGGTIACEVHTRFRGEKKLGGCCSISGPMLPESIWAQSSLPNQEGPFGPVLVTVGGAETKASRAEVDQGISWMREQQGDVRLHEVKRKGHAMVSSSDEMRALMSFWAETLSKDFSQDGVFEVTRS